MYKLSTISNVHRTSARINIREQLISTLLTLKWSKEHVYFIGHIHVNYVSGYMFLDFVTQAFTLRQAARPVAANDNFSSPPNPIHPLFP